MPHERPDHAPVIVWFRRDLRLDDNLALQAAAETGRPVLCVYIREDEADHAGSLGAAQAWWLHHSLASLNESLHAKGNKLLLLSGKPLDILLHLKESAHADAVFWNRRYDADGVRQDTEIKARLREAGLQAKSFAGFLMHEPMKLLTGQGRYYKVFTPFWKAFEAQFRPDDPLPAPKSLKAPEHFPRGESLDRWALLPKHPNWATGFSDRWQPGEKGALARLDDFLDGAVDGYGKKRDLPAVPATSGLSPHLAMGEISPHRIWNATGEAFDAQPADDLRSFRRELVWREFAWHQLFHKPDMQTVNLDRRFDAFPWRNDRKALKAWQQGRTGYPLVDAGMRELWQTGVMHNRVRMIVASFLIKDLLLDWRAGERWFRDTLVDIDHASNAMNWQWVAGCGADASPWFRIFNPVRQGETFDPDGAYVRRYCTELADMPDKFIHRPFEAPKAVLEKAGVTLGSNYPEPMVQHDAARDRALDAFKSLPKSEPSAS